MISSILLAAGMSTRMGKLKQLLDWGGEPLIAYQVKQLVEAGCDEVIVVLGFHGDEIHRSINKLPCRVMLNPRFHAGRAGSLRIGAKAMNRDADAVVIANVDQPRPASLVASLVAAHDPKYAATRYSYEGHSGHPLVVSGWLRPELLEASDASDGLRGIIRAHASEVQELPGDAMCTLDVNTPEEYAAAAKQFGFAS